MSDVLKRYYEKSTAIPQLVRDKIRKFQNNPDICEEVTLQNRLLRYQNMPEENLPF